jgi:uncharacterized lipoprotein YbaY
MKKHLLLAIALSLLLTACAPASVGAFFAPCPVPTAEEWEAAQAEWLTSAGAGEQMSLPISEARTAGSSSPH